MKKIKQQFFASILTAGFMTSCATYNNSEPVHFLTGIKDDGNDQVELLFNDNEKTIITFQKSNDQTPHVGELQIKHGDIQNLVITNAKNKEVDNFKYESKKYGDLFIKYGQNYSGSDGNPKIASIVKYTGNTGISFDFTK